LTTQPLLGAATCATALVAVGVSWLVGAPVWGGNPVLLGIVAASLGAAALIAYRYPLHLVGQAKVQLATVPYFLMAALLPPPVAAVAAGCGALAGELAVRRQRGTYYSDIAGAVGRRMLIVLAGAIVALLTPTPGRLSLALLAAAAVMEGLDIVTAPIVLAPMSHEPPRRIIRAVARDAYLVESAQYLLGLLGALAARQELWSMALLILPTTLVYLAFHAMQRAEQAQREAEEARARSAEAERMAQEAVCVRDDFLTAASHDLRTPLTNIVGRADLIQMRLDSNLPVTEAWLRDQLNPLRQAADRMFSTIEEMTDAVQLQMGQPLTFEVGLIDIGEMVQHIARATMSPCAGAGPLLVEITTPVFVHGDRSRLERVVQNVVDNAVKFSPKGRPVQIEVDRDEPWAVIRVKDRGIGIPAAEIPHIFTRFYRASNAARAKGSGIGLAGARAIIEQHGGHIAVDSAVGQGTTVTIYLPGFTALGKSAAAPYPSHQPAQRGTPGIDGVA
jgi:signal transduction histidine kinase